MKKLLPIFLLLFSCSPDAPATEPGTANAGLFVNGDTTYFDQKEFSLFSQLSGGGYSIFLSYYDLGLQQIQQLEINGPSHTPGIFLLGDNNNVYFGLNSFSLQDTNVHYYNQNSYNPTDSNFIQIYNLTTHRVNGDFHCYVDTYYDTTLTGINLATGYFDFVMP